MQESNETRQREGMSSGAAAFVGLQRAQELRNAGNGPGQPERDQSPIARSMSRLYNTITDARAEVQMLAGRLQPVLPPTRPQTETKSGEILPGPCCQMDAELQEYQRLAQDIVDLARLLQSELRI